MFGFCIIHILNTGCAKIWKKIRRQKVNGVHRDNFAVYLYWIYTYLIRWKDDQKIRAVACFEVLSSHFLERTWESCENLYWRGHIAYIGFLYSLSYFKLYNMKTGYTISRSNTWPNKTGNVSATTVAVENSKCYMFWECVCSLKYPVCNAYAPYCVLWPVRRCNISPHYFINGTIFGENVIEYEMRVLIFSTGFICNISHFAKNWTGYDQKYILVSM